MLDLRRRLVASRPVERRAVVKSLAPSQTRIKRLRPRVAGYFWGVPRALAASAFLRSLESLSGQDGRVLHVLRLVGRLRLLQEGAHLLQGLRGQALRRKQAQKLLCPELERLLERRFVAHPGDRPSAEVTEFNTVG